MERSEVFRKLFGAIALLCSYGAFAADGSGKLDTEGEIARAYSDWALSQGDTKGAARELEDQLTRFPDDSKTRAALSRLEARQGNSQAAADTPSGGSFGLRAGARTGYDSNVLLISDNVLSVQSISGNASPLVGADLLVTGSQQQENREIRYQAGTFFNWYTAEKANQYSALAVRAGGAYRITPLGEFILDSSASFLNVSGFGYYGFSSTLGWERPIAEPSIGKLFAGARFRWQDFADPATGAVPSQDRDGPALGGHLRMDSRFSGGQTLASLLEFERAFTAGDEFRATTVVVQTSWSIAMGASDRLLAGLRLAYTDYTDSSQQRHDGGVFLAPGWTRKIGPRTQSSLSYLLNLNRSNVDEASFSKHVLSLQVSHEIL